MTPEILKARTKAFARAVIEFVSSLAQRGPTRLIGDQLIRSAASVGSNYRAACRARSRAEFAAKMGIVLEEADESLYWMELLVESHLVPNERLTPLMKEAEELVAVAVASIKTARQAAARGSQNGRKST